MIECLRKEDIPDHKIFICPELNEPCMGCGCMMVDEGNINNESFYCELQGLYFES